MHRILPLQAKTGDLPGLAEIAGLGSECVASKDIFLKIRETEQSFAGYADDNDCNFQEFGCAR